MIIITPPDLQQLERALNDSIIESSLVTGVHRLHLRLPGASQNEYKQILDRIAPRYHRQIILCDHYDLLKHYDLGGIYLPYRRVSEWREITLAPNQTVAVGAHSIRELESLPQIPNYALLSPLFDSISKHGYKGNTSLRSCRQELRELPYPVYALGGITPNKQEEVTQAGYAGIAVLGDIWSKSPELQLDQLDQYNAPAILSIAGHDPTSGAGISVDTRIANSLSVQCYSVISALTVQSLKRFISATPTPLRMLEESLATLLGDHPVTVSKIGMVQDLQQLLQILSLLTTLGGAKRIIWDPILQPTAAGKTQPNLWQRSQELSTILTQVDLITPNHPEALALFGTTDLGELQRIIQNTRASILLKGGHDSSSPHIVVSYLITKDGIYPLYSHRYDKSIHGTGCMLSTAIACYWAMEYNILGAVERACHYLSLIFAGQPNIQGQQLLSLKETSQRKRQAHCKQHFALQYVTNESLSTLLYNKVSQYLEAGGRWVQLRLKNSSTERRIEIGLCLRSLTNRFGACLIIDDDILATIAVGADGVHLGKSDCPPQEARRVLGDNYIIGYTVNSLADLPRALAADVDYIGVGPYRKTKTKTLLAPILGPEGITQINSRVRSLKRSHKPLLVAIGGILPKDARELFEDCLISGIAMSGAIEDSPEIATTVKQILKALPHSTKQHTF